jgi:hypothetical protein
MKELILTVALLLTAPVLVSGQFGDQTYRGDAYFFIAPIISNARQTFNPACYGRVFGFQAPPAYCFSNERGGANAGFGGEVFVHEGLAVGGEAGYGGQDWKFDGNGVGVGSVNASYHFLGRKNHRRAEPFVTGGYSLYFGDRTDFQSGFNLGGGVNLWVAQHAALRFEVREQDHIAYFHSQFTRFVAFRVGITFR